VADPPPDLKPDDPLTADWLNRFLAWGKSGRITTAADSGLESSAGPGGTALGLRSTPDLWVKLTYAGPAGDYSWIEQVPGPGGAWANGPRKGLAQADPARGSARADPAWEANGNASLAVGFRCEASRDAAVGRLTIRARACP